MYINYELRNRRILFALAALLLIMTACEPKAQRGISVKAGFAGHYVSRSWLDALQSRQSSVYLDSLENARRPLTEGERNWLTLIQSKTVRWNSFRDSLNIPFGKVTLSDSIYILTGYQGGDDGFTWQHQTVCLDLTALHDNYGPAESPENNERIDRIFSHEYTHLLHKGWAKNNNLVLKNFEDSILWECLYEGTGMYRSLSKKWTLQGNTLPSVTQDALDKLYPVFVDRLIRIHQLENPTSEEKAGLHKNLSRGGVDKKWGAFPVAVWLMQESKGDDANLVRWIDGGTQSVLELAFKYLPATESRRLRTAFLPDKN